MKGAEVFLPSIKNDIRVRRTRGPPFIPHSASKAKSSLNMWEKWTCLGWWLEFSASCWLGFLWPRTPRQWRRRYRQGWSPRCKALSKTFNTTANTAKMFGSADHMAAAGHRSAIFRPRIAGAGVVHAVGPYKMVCASPIVATEDRSVACSRIGWHQ